MAGAEFEKQFGAEYRQARENLAKPEIPKVNLYPLDQNTGRQGFIDALSRLPEQLHLEPWSSTEPETIIKEALERGYFTDSFPHQLFDKAKTTRPTDYFDEKPNLIDRYLRQHDRLVYGTIAEYDWKIQGRFVRVFPYEYFYQVAFSRNKYVVPPEVQEKLRNTRFGIVGLGVGTACGNLLVHTGAEKFRICDGGVQDLHDHNRLMGAEASQINTNQAIRWTRLALGINPYLDIDCHPQNLAPGPNTLAIDDFLQGVDIVIEEADFFPAKVGVRLEAAKKGIPVYMVTDLGQAGLVQKDFGTIFNGRLTPEALAKLKDPKATLAQKTELARDVIVGENNIPQPYKDAVEKVIHDKSSYWPQLGATAALSGSMAVVAILGDLGGGEISTQTLVDLEQAIRTSNS